MGNAKFRLARNVWPTFHFAPTTNDAVSTLSPVLEGEVDWSVRCEGAATLEDFLYRRSRAPLYDTDVCRAIAEPAGRRMAHLLDWDERRLRSDLSAVEARLAADRRWGD